MQCDVTNDCENDAAYGYTWAWGEEGACCTSHRSLLESKSHQLGRSIEFFQHRRPYNPPTLEKLDPKLAELKLQLADAAELVKAKDERIAELETLVFQLRAQLEEVQMKVQA